MPFLEFHDLHPGQLTELPEDFAMADVQQMIDIEARGAFWTIWADYERTEMIERWECYDCGMGRQDD